jgi:hypothetical protein
MVTNEEMREARMPSAGYLAPLDSGRDGARLRAVLDEVE